MRTKFSKDECELYCPRVNIQQELVDAALLNLTNQDLHFEGSKFSNRKLNKMRRAANRRSINQNVKF